MFLFCFTSNSLSVSAKKYKYTYQQGLAMRMWQHAKHAKHAHVKISMCMYIHTKLAKNGFKKILIYMRQHLHVKFCLLAILNINFQMFSVRGPCDPLYDRQLVEGFCHSLPHRPSVVSGRCFQVVFLHRSYFISGI